MATRSWIRCVRFQALDSHLGPLSRRFTCCCRSACWASCRGNPCSTRTVSPPRRRSTWGPSSSSEPGVGGAALAVTVLVLVTAFASLYGNLLGFSRISFAAARDGAFLPIFGRLHPRKDFPHVALLTVGALSLIASLFTLDQVIAFLTAGIVLIQGIAQIVALAVLRARGASGPFRMPLYPFPALLALGGWALAFVATGYGAIALGAGWLICGSIVYLVAARMQRWWPFLLALLLAVVLRLRRVPPPCRDGRTGTSRG